MFRHPQRGHCVPAGIVAARLTFEEVVRFVVPMTYWWNDRNNGTEIARYLDDPALAADVATILEAARRKP